MEKGQEEKAERHPLEPLIGSRVKVICSDGRVFVGKLAGLDQVLNFILSEAEERVYSTEAGVGVHQLGVYFIRGDAIAALGAMEESEEELEGLGEVRGKPLVFEL